MESGSSFAGSPAQRRDIVLTNGLALVASTAVAILIFFRFIRGADYEAFNLYLLAGAIIFLAPIILNRLGFTTASRLAMCWLPPIFALLASFQSLSVHDRDISSYLGLRYYMLSFCCAPFLIFRIPREKAFIAGLAVPIAGILLFDEIFELVNLGYQGVDERGYAFNNVRAGIALFITSAACYMLKSRADRSEHINSKLISELAEKNEAIQRQASDKVHELNRELLSHLQQLSEREFILNQSQRIAKIGSWEYTVKGASIFWSDEMYNIFGLDRSFDVKPQNLGEAIGGDAGQVVLDSTNNLLKNGQPFDLTFRTRTPVGYNKWLRLAAFPVIEKGAILGVRGICHDITYYKEAEERLRASDNKYKSLFEQASDAILVTDLQGNFTDVNSSLCKMLAYTREELLRMNISALIDADDLSQRPIVLSWPAPGTHLFNERRVIAKDGTIRDVEANLKQVDENSIMAIVRDVTELREAQKQIQISEAKFRGAFEFSAIGMTMVSLEGKWLQVNREFCNIVGYTEAELIGRRFQDITAPEDLGTNEDLFSKATRGEIETYRLEKRYIHRNGSIVWANLNVAIIKDEDGEPLYCVSQIEDITNEKLAKEQLMLSQANLRATINNTNILIWSVDREYKMITCNDPFFKYIKKYYGFEPRVGVRMSMDFPINEREGMTVRWTERYDRALAGETFQLEETRNGIDLQYSLNPIVEKNQVIGATIFAENITKRKAHDRELAEANKKIDELKLMALRSVMSPHFIFNVLNSIQFFIAKNDRLNAINYLSTFSKLIRSILNHSVTNKIRLADEVEMLKNYVQLEMTRFEQKFSFKLEVGPEIDLDSIEIPSLLIQPYVENAILHGLYNKKLPGTLWIRVTEEDDLVVFEIEDNGVGRAEAMQIRKQNFPGHKSMGIRLTEERLKLIKQHSNAAFEIEDLMNDAGACGTRVRISLPY